MRRPTGLGALRLPAAALLLAGCLPTASAPPPAAPPTSPAATAAATAVDPRVAAIEARIRARLDSLRASAQFPGATVGFVLPDGRSGAVATGLADTEAGTPMRPGDRMLAGSIGKTFAAALAMRLAAEGRLPLDAPVSRWLGGEPWFDRLPNAREITVRMLLQHTAGIEEHVQDTVFQAAIRAAPDRVWRPEELVAYVVGRPPLFPAGRGWSYADTHFILLGMVLERITGTPFYDEARRRFLEPLRLDATAPSDRRDLPGLVPGYIAPEFNPFGLATRTVEGGRFVVNPQFEWTGGGFVTTSRDLAVWAKALYEGRAFPAAWVDSMTASVPAKTGPGDRYGLGAQIKQTPLGVAWGHSGWFPGYLSEVLYFPEYRVAVAVQFNTDHGRRLGRGLRRYVDEAAGIVVRELHPDRAASLAASEAGWYRPAAPPGPATPVTPGDFFTDPAARAALALCDSMGAMVERALGVGARREPGSFADHFGGGRRSGCRLSARVAPPFAAPSDRLRSAFRERGWREDPSYAADGPGGTATGFRRGGILCLLRAGEEPPALVPQGATPAVRVVAECFPDRPAGARAVPASIHPRERSP